MYFFICIYAVKLLKALVSVLETTMCCSFLKTLIFLLNIYYCSLIRQSIICLITQFINGINRISKLISNSSPTCHSLAILVTPLGS